MNRLISVNGETVIHRSYLRKNLYWPEYSAAKKFYIFYSWNFESRCIDIMS